MTDKERYGFDVEIEMRHLKEIVEKDDILTISSRFTRYLIEQAERAQELGEIKNDAIEQIDVTQERNKRLENCVQELEEQLQGLHKMYDIRLAKSDGFEKQNKRYREALEEITSSPLGGSYTDVAEADRYQRIARKALEGEE